MVFFNLRQGTDTVQGLLIVTPDKVSKQMVKWAAGLADESIVLVEGIAKEVQVPIKSATISNVEVHISQARIKASFSTAFLNILTAPPDSRTRLSPAFYGRGCQSSGNKSLILLKSNISVCVSTPV
jgi:aspartyl/asparaginyl-tRNA synthetase